MQKSPNENEHSFICEPIVLSNSLCAEYHMWYPSESFWPQSPFPTLSFPVGSDAAEEGSAG